MSRYSLQVVHQPDNNHGLRTGGCELRIFEPNAKGGLSEVVAVRGNNCPEKEVRAYGSILTRSATLGSMGVVNAVANFALHVVSQEGQDRVAEAVAPIMREALLEGGTPHPGAAELGAAIMAGTFGAEAPQSPNPVVVQPA